MKINLVTDLGKHLYRYCSLRKLDTPIDTVQEFAEAYCTREGLPSPQILNPDSGNPIVLLTVPEIRLDVFTKFKSSFTVHGYTAPSLEVREIDDQSNDQE